jgi:hypothetical protein
VSPSVTRRRRPTGQPARPWTDGRAELSDRTPQSGWAHATAWTGSTERTAALGRLTHHDPARATTPPVAAHP